MKDQLVKFFINNELQVRIGRIALAINVFDENRFRHGIPEATILVIFGASGDLTRRKLMPALYHLSRENLLPQKFQLFGLGRRIQKGEEFKTHVQHRIIQYCTHKMEMRYWLPLSDKLESIRADYSKNETFEILHKKIRETEEIWGEPANLLIYLATNPSHFEMIVENVAKAGLNKQSGEKWTRVIVEKPFGLNRNSATTLNNILREHYDENQIYRIDHFLGKEAIQNILLFRIYNVIFQPLWSNQFIDHIQIVSSETIGVEGRVEFFEQTGVVRDMIQSHLLQILTFLTLELPENLDPEVIRDRKVELLKSIRIYKTDQEIEKNTVRGQFGSGVVNSELVPGYRDVEGIPKDSMVETYAAVKIFIENDQWSGVPIYIRSGKRMSTRKSEIFIQLKNSINLSPLFEAKSQPNSIKLLIQPQAGIQINMGWKPAGILSEIEPTQLGIRGDAMLKEPKAYERLFVDAMRGDSTLFIRFDEILAMWDIVDPIIDFWKRKQDHKDIFPNYFAGAQGPKISDEFIKKDGREWIKI